MSKKEDIINTALNLFNQIGSMLLVLTVLLLNQMLQK